jgi:hypothetical protein
VSGLEFPNLSLVSILKKPLLILCLLDLSRNNIKNFAQPLVQWLREVYSFNQYMEDRRLGRLKR